MSVCRGWQGKNYAEGRWGGGGEGGELKRRKEDVALKELYQRVKGSRIRGKRLHRKNGLCHRNEAAADEVEGTRRECGC